MVEVIGEISSQFSELIESVFPMIDFINHKNNIRIVSTTDQELERETFYIYSTAVPNGFVGGNWRDAENIMIDGEQLLIGSKTRVIDCTSIPEPWKGIFLDDHYIGCKDHNKILLFCGLNEITYNGFCKILNRFDITVPSPKEVMMMKLDKLFAVATREKRKSVEIQMDQVRTSMDTAFASFQRDLKKLEELSWSVEGIQEFDMNGIEKQLDRLLESPDVKEILIKRECIQVITNPIYLWKWNLGEFEITYNFNGSLPTFDRINPPSRIDAEFAIRGRREREGLESGEVIHPHISGSICYGNTKDLLKTFWERDYLTGFQFALQYLRSYNSGDSHWKIEQILCNLGYIHDAEILNDHGGIWKIHNLKILNRDGELTGDILESWGCNAQIATPEEMQQFYEDSRWGQLKKAIENGSSYHQQDYLEPGTDEPEFHCDNCGDEIYIGQEHIFDGVTMCDDCYSDMVRICISCGREMWTDDSFYSDELDESYCHDCYWERHRTCEECGSDYPNEMCEERDDGVIRCSECWEEELARRAEDARTDEGTHEEDETTTVMVPRYRMVDGHFTPIGEGE